MTDAISFFFFDPLGLSLLVSVTCAIGALVWLLLTTPLTTIVIERLKPGYNVVHKATEKRIKNPGEYELKLKTDGRKFTVPEGKEGDHETLYVPKTVRLKKGYRKLWIIESGQLVKFAGSIKEVSEGLITPGMIPTIIGRGSLKRLATAKGLAGGGWTMVILAVGMGLAVGYIIYPQFNHPGTVIEYCKGAGQNVTCGLVP